MKFPKESSGETVCASELVKKHPAQFKVLEYCLRPIFDTYELMHELNKRAAIRYDPSVAANEKKLLAVMILSWFT